MQFRFLKLKEKVGKDLDVEFFSAQFSTHFVIVKQIRTFVSIEVIVGGLAEIASSTNHVCFLKEQKWVLTFTALHTHEYDCKISHYQGSHTVSNSMRICYTE
ncbi:hypothetical protein D8674_010730 [Pyrus ussuriensis x Pyrus communis]|uniref:Uncharacterized protein n=1 Tax=Pyrus ussuriensis x Pyrus communis TaxID=2448454 RepID=A0A5N5FBJ1_9ROSA|nr:hypothetical protein D8674_010730 [Pyrus ussuriensis x Pyrus communis]